jgi:hypothetical protein
MSTCRTLDCLGDTQPAQGSWTLNLTSVARYGGAGGSGDTYDTVHGTLTATMLSEGGTGTATTTFSASF